MFTGGLFGEQDVGGEQQPSKRRKEGIIVLFVSSSNYHQLLSTL